MYFGFFHLYVARKDRVIEIQNLWEYRPVFEIPAV
jgi:hypothetical protein